MSGRSLNVVILTVDTLRADRMSAYGYARPTTPEIDRLRAESVFCEQAFTHGPFTQNACPQIFTSSRPLSYGGYSEFVTRRPRSLFATFRDAGHHTTGLANVHWVNRLYGYDGLDVELPLFVLNTLVGMTVVALSDTLRQYHEGRIDVRTAVERGRGPIGWLFDSADTFSDLQIAHYPDFARCFPDTILVRAGYDYRRVKKVTARHRAAFAADAEGYFARHLDHAPPSHGWIAREWSLCRKPGRFVREAFDRAGDALLRHFDTDQPLRRRSRTLHYPDAMSLAGRVLDAVRDRPADRPFFVWAHFKDTHQPFVSGYGRHWYRQTPERLAALGYDKALGAQPWITFRPNGPRDDDELEMFSALYDAAVRSTDEAIGAIVRGIDGMGLGEDTLVAICADHGEELGEHGDFGHTCHFYEHNVRIPMIFRRKGMAARTVGTQVSLLDFAPTAAALCGIAPDARWEGNPVIGLEDSARPILFETFCRGTCRFADRPVYLGVRTPDFKLLWKEYRDVNDRFGQDGHELYDLHADPTESENLYDAEHPFVQTHLPLIANRLAELPEIDDARVIAVFGSLGEAALTRKRGSRTNQ